MIVVLVVINVAAVPLATITTTVRVAVEVEILVMLEAFFNISGKRSVLQQCYTKLQVHYNIDLGSSLDISMANFM